MKKFILFVLLSSLSLLASEIEIKDAYVRASPPGVPNTAAFMEIVNHTNKNISLIEVNTNISKIAELHTHEMKNGIMKMYQVPKIVIPANGKTILKPGGFHIMVIGLNKALKKGGIVELEMIFSNKYKTTIEVPIKSVMNGMIHKEMDHSQHMKHMNHQ